MAGLIRPGLDQRVKQEHCESEIRSSAKFTSMARRALCPPKPQRNCERLGHRVYKHTCIERFNVRMHIEKIRDVCSGCKHFHE